MLVTGATWTAEVPHEKGTTFTFRRLSWREWEEAAEVKRQQVFAMMQTLPADLLAAIRNRETVSGQDTEQFDTATVLHKGVVGWTYTDDVTPQNIDMLDAETADWALAQLMASKEANAKNSASASTGA